MSIDLNWETLTTGPDGEALANSIRDFIHTKFQAVSLPRFIKSVVVHEFEFGSVPPEVELRDITDPLPDFYEDALEDEDDSGDEGEGEGDGEDDGEDEGEGEGDGDSGRNESERPRSWPSRDKAINLPQHDRTSPYLGVSTPGILGSSASNLHYFQSHLGTGTQTPLAAVAGAHLGVTRHQSHTLDHFRGAGGFRSPGVTALRGGNGIGLGNGHGTRSVAASSAEGSKTGGTGEGRVGWRPPNLRPPTISILSIPSPSPTVGGNQRHAPSHGPLSIGDLSPGIAPAQAAVPPALVALQGLRGNSSVSTLAPTSAGHSRPSARDRHASGSATVEGEGGGSGNAATGDSRHSKGMGGKEKDDGGDGKRGARRPREPRVEDVQAVFRIRYAGDVRLNLTTEILLDYPMPSFVNIPVRLSITGLTFDGVGVLAHIRRRVHFCFLSPEDAAAAVGVGPDSDGGRGEEDGKRVFGGLLQEIKVDSEIGLREHGKQSLRNVGKVEKFVLEQVRRIFEDEFVYPSSWTLLV